MRVRPQFEAALTAAREIKAMPPRPGDLHRLRDEAPRENIREATLEGLDTAVRKGNHGGLPPVTTDDMLHTVLRRRANGETVEEIQPDLLILTDHRKGQIPSLSSVYRALAEHEKTQAYPEAIETAHADFAALHQRDPSPA